LKDPFSSRVGWISFRIVDEMIKRVYLSNITQRFMPVSLNEIGLKLAPSALLTLPLAPANFYDTL